MTGTLEALGVVLADWGLILAWSLWRVLLWSLGLGIAAIVYLVAGWRVYVVALAGSILGVILFMLDPPKGFWEAYLPHPSTWVHVTRLRRHHEPREPCPGCGGKGYRVKTIRWGRAGGYHREKRVRCENCNGSGTVPRDVEP